MKVQELLESAGIKKEVIEGLPKDVLGRVETYLTDADGKLQTASEAQRKADEALRIAALEKKDVEEYVTNYGNGLTRLSSLEAKNKAYETYLQTLKGQGFDIPADLGGSGAKPAVPGSPAEGGNALDEGKILGKVGSFMAQWLDANNEHIRLHGTPIPEGSEALAAEATQARKPLSQYAAEKYKFAEKRKEREQADYQKRVDDEVKAKLEEERRAAAERDGSNPNLRPGVPSRNSFVPKLKPEEFHKADGNVSDRERRTRMLDKIHAELSQSA